MRTGRTATAWDQAQGLASWLNLRRTDQTGDAESRVPAQARVRKAIEHLREMNRLAKGHARGSGFEESAEGRTIKQALIALTQQLEAPRLGWRVLPLGSYYGLDLTPKPWTEADYAFLLLRDVSKAGLLEWLRQCRRCQTWFVTKRAKKVFCSSNCQEEFWFEFRKTPEGLKEQRDRMRRCRAKQQQKSRPRRARR